LNADIGARVDAFLEAVIDMLQIDNSLQDNTGNPALFYAIAS